MAPTHDTTSKKRPRPPHRTAMKPGKQQKLASRTANSSSKAEILSPGRNVRPDDLSWTEVSVQGRLDDFEGFFGLEEASGVDIVKDPEGGKVAFRQVAPSHEKAKAQGKSSQSEELPTSNISQSEEPMVLEQDPVQHEEELSDEEEWEGFSDNNAVDCGSKTSKSNGSHKMKAKDDLGFISRNLSFDVLLRDSDDEEIDMSAWNELNLSNETLSSLSKLKFARPTPIQSTAILEILSGHDTIGKAATGSGKTLAYGIPLLEFYLQETRLRQRPNSISVDKPPPLALIMSPTRELAHQITAHLSALFSNAGFVGPSLATLTGGLSVQKQQRLLKNANVIIGTPGRLWEVLSQDRDIIAWLQKVKYLVIDEADRLLSDGHFKEFDEIINALDRVTENDEDEEAVENKQSLIRQTLVFSATLHKDMHQRLAGKWKPRNELPSKKESLEYLLARLKFRESKPKFIDINPVKQMAQGLREGIIECGGIEKDLYLYALLLYYPNARTLVFTNSISAVRRLVPYLQNLNLRTHALHSHMPQKARLRSIERFSSQPGSILVATDVAARGLDIPNVELVLHYHLPRAADMYIHRSGRTARVENIGTSIILCSPEEVVGVRRLVAKVHASHSEGSSKRSHFIQSLDMDRRVVAKLKPRVTLAKKIADTAIAKEKKNNDDDIFKAAAEDLGVDYDSEEMEKAAIGRRGRGIARRRSEREARNLSKSEVQALRAELRGLLSQKVNIGVSEKYLTGGGLDVDALLKGVANADFLGTMPGIQGFED
ncbi:ATP-dependent RNA helicase-like protein MAK5 [Lineolata rhizophorae]|uniref:ATP-dependent RNA helicase n=1 Tax=Lineolata rhizophorae TaxID=578093 RepID=A0A6A6NPQ2_9PEZI|nr:ATP-dependent RNA helicase-like protein MAK5 [Lineolata rhizophorae]